MENIEAGAPQGAAEGADSALHQDSPVPESPHPEAPEAVASTTPAPPVEDGLDAKVERAIQTWVVEHIHNSPVSRDTEAMNHLRSRLGELRRLICQEI